ncbi:MAG TPA: DUF5666 domain-containing protein [Anaerolineales bacterium]|nr:DUF5666 domain-containing protein [Anaerolineales bacterium]
MNTKAKTVIRWPLVIVCLGVMVGLAGCASSGGSTTGTPVPTETASLRLEDGAVKVQDEEGGWVPVGGETTFELVGELESTEPWMVTGNTFAVRDTTHIAEGLETGDLVRVKGLILEDGTWLANFIELAEGQIDPTVVLIGKVDSVDPWMVHGITLNVTADTTVAEEIAPGMIVEVEILLRADGTWEVLSITPLSDFTQIPGCTTVTATVVSVEGNQVRFRDWPALEIDEDIKIEDEGGKDATLNAGQMVLVVICTTEEGQFIITKIIVLKAGADGTSANGEKVLICHKPDKKGGHTLSIASPAVPAHLAHGDKLGPCH